MSGIAVSISQGTPLLIPSYLLFRCPTTTVRIVVAYMQKYAGIWTTLYPYILSQESVNHQLLMRIKKTFWPLRQVYIA